MPIKKPGINSNDPAVGSVGVDAEYTSYDAAEVGLAVSRSAYQRGIRENANIKGVYQAVISYLSKLTDQDIADRLNEYGDARYLGKSFNRAQALDQLAEAMIVRLSKKDLMQIIGVVDTENKRFITNTLKDRSSKTSSFNIGSLQSYADELGDADISKRKGKNQFKEMLARKSSNYFGVDAVFNRRHGLPKLYKEVIALYKQARPEELAETALGIGISFEDDITQKELVSRIANKVCLYAAIILGKTKIVAAIGGEQANNIKRILAFTSFAYVAGLQQMSQEELNQERMQMEVARRMAKEVNKAKRRRARKKDFVAAYGQETGSLLARLSKTGLLDKSFAGIVHEVKQLTAGEANALRIQINASQNMSVPLYDDADVRENTPISKLTPPEDALQDNDPIKAQILAFRQRARDIINAKYKTSKIINIAKTPLEALIVVMLQDAPKMEAQKRANDTQLKKHLRASKIFKPWDIKGRENAQIETQLRNTSLDAEKEIIGGLPADAPLSDEEAALKSARDKYAVPLVELDYRGGVRDIESLMQAVPVAIVADARKIDLKKQKEYDETIQLKKDDDAIFAKYKNSNNGQGLTPQEMERYLEAYLRRNPDKIDIIAKQLQDLRNEYPELLKKDEDARHRLRELEPEIRPTDIAEATTKKERPATITKDGKTYTFDERVNQYRVTEGEGKGKFAGKMGYNDDGELQLDADLKEMYGTIFDAMSTNVKEVKPKERKRAKEKDELTDLDVVDDDAVFNDYAIDHYKYIYIGKRHPIQPVFVTNKFADLIGDILTNIDAATGVQSNILNYLQTSLPLLFTGLQMFGMAANVSAGTSTAVGIKEIVTSAAGAAAEMSKLKLHARGAVSEPGQGGDGITQFIAGDSENGAPNEEMVNIDWENRQYAVKPVERSGDQVKPAQKGYRELSTAEREAPLMATLAGGYVQYSRNLDDVTDDGNKTALKVYNIGTGINDKVKVGDTEMSLFDVIYGIYGAVMTTNTQLTQSNQLLTAIAGNTANTVTAVNNSAKSGGNNTDPSGGFSDALSSILRGE